MKSFKSHFLAAIPFLLAACFSDRIAAPPAENREEGAASVVIDVGKVGALTKSSASARIDLARLRITLSGFGEKEINDTFSLGGTSPIVFAKTYSGLAANKKWTLTARSLDSRDSVIHMGVVAFPVEHRKTAVVRLDLAARFSWMTARFFPIRDSVNRVALLVDNALRAQQSFQRQVNNGDTIALAYDYLEVGRRNVKMQAHGSWDGVQTLLYAADTNITVTAGADAQYWIDLKWVGPRAAPIGAASITVSLGSAGNVVLNGHLRYDHEDGFRYYRIAFEDREDEAVRRKKTARMKLKTAFFKADGNSYPEEGAFEIVSVSAMEAGGVLTDLLKDKAEKRGWVHFKDLDWTLVIDMKKKLKFQEAVIEADNFKEFESRGAITVHAADDLLGPWTVCGQTGIANLITGGTFVLKY